MSKNIPFYLSFEIWSYSMKWGAENKYNRAFELECICGWSDDFDSTLTMTH
jgi:hypothetical protein